MMWISFYRKNPHRFVSDYLKINLRDFQKILLNAIFMNTNFMYLAARGQGKTFIMAIYCVVRCILFPGTKICICSKTREQAAETIMKIITDFVPKSPNLNNEIDWKGTSTKLSNARVNFKNGSWIAIVTANENSRHFRANVVFIDEFRMVDPIIVNTVVRKFLTAPREPDFLSDPKYKDRSDLVEKNSILFASSCWYKSHWSYQQAKDYFINMVNGKNYFICALPYQLSIKEKLYLREDLENEMSESAFSEVSFIMELCCLFYSDGDGSFFRYSDIEKNRNIHFPMLPKETSSLVSDKRIAIPPKQKGEIRNLSADIAMMASGKLKNNDATAIFINRMIPNSRGQFVSHIVYTECHEGLRTERQSLIIRQLFEEYDCDYITIDKGGYGFGVCDALLAPQYDQETGKYYPALSCCNNEELANRCTDSSAPKVIFAVSADAKFNGQCAKGLREAFRQGKVKLLASEVDARKAYLKELNGYNKLDVEDKVKIEMSYIHTTLLINELIKLETVPNGAYIKVREKSGMRKDRYSSLSYNIYVANQLERTKIKNKSNNKEDSLKIIFKTPQLTRRQ